MNQLYAWFQKKKFISKATADEWRKKGESFEGVDKIVIFEAIDNNSELLIEFKITMFNISLNCP